MDREYTGLGTGPGAHCPKVQSAESVNKYEEDASQQHVNHEPQEQKSAHGINNSYSLLSINSKPGTLLRALYR